MERWTCTLADGTLLIKSAAPGAIHRSPGGHRCLCVGCDAERNGGITALVLLALQAPLGNMSQAVAALQHHLHVTKLGRDELERWVHQQSIILQVLDRCSTTPGLVHMRECGSMLERVMLKHVLCSAVHASTSFLLQHCNPGGDICSSKPLRGFSIAVGCASPGS